MKKTDILKKEIKKLDKLVKIVDMKYKKFLNLRDLLLTTKDFKLHDLAMTLNNDNDFDMFNDFTFIEFQEFSRLLEAQGFTLEQIGRTSQHLIVPDCSSPLKSLIDWFNDYKFDEYYHDNPYSLTDNLLWFLNDCDYRDEMQVFTDLFEGKTYSVGQVIKNYACITRDRGEILDDLIETINELNQVIIDVLIVDYDYYNNTIQSDLKDYKIIKDYVKTFKDNQIELFNNYKLSLI